MSLTVEPIAVHGEWIRHAPHRSALLGRSDRLTSKRWQRDEVVRALYLADESGTAVAEWYRFLAERGLWPRGSVPHDHHRWDVSIDVADLGTAERLAAVGLATPEPTRHAWSAFQAVGEELWRDGWSGLLAPSAARPSGNVLCVFADVWPPAGCFPVGVEEIYDVPIPPTGMTT
jgi:RES domain-containing protein